MRWLNKNIKQYYNKIENINYLKKVFQKEKPHIVFHLAAQALVIESYNKPMETFYTNTLGAINILESIRSINKKVPIIFITTDKVYANLVKRKLVEKDLLEGNDPYSTSKVCAEHITKSYTKLGIRAVTVRAGNIIGGGDWATNRIIPDIIKAIYQDKLPTIRNPLSIRPWLYVLDAIEGYLVLGIKLLNDKSLKFDTYNLAPNYKKNYNVETITKKLLNEFNSFKYNIKRNYESNLEKKFLSISSKKIENLNLWQPKTSIDEAIRMTAYWYKTNYKKNSTEISVSYINNYFNLKKTSSKERSYV